MPDIARSLHVLSFLLRHAANGTPLLAHTADLPTFLHRLIGHNSPMLLIFRTAVRLDTQANFEPPGCGQRAAPPLCLQRAPRTRRTVGIGACFCGASVAQNASLLVNFCSRGVPKSRRPFQVSQCRSEQRVRVLLSHTERDLQSRTTNFVRPLVS